MATVYEVVRSAQNAKDAKNGIDMLLSLDGLIAGPAKAWITYARDNYRKNKPADRAHKILRTACARFLETATSYELGMDAGSVKAKK